MIKQKALVLAVAAVLAMPLAACGNSGSSTSTDTKSETTTTQSSSSSSDSKTKDASYYAGQWRGSVETTGQTVYGTAGGFEPMLDVNISDDGTCTVVPLEAHADLLNDKGTWEGTADKLTLHLEKAGDIELTSSGKNSLEGDAHAFDIADFDTIQFDFYG